MPRLKSFAARKLSHAFSALGLLFAGSFFPAVLSAASAVAFRSDTGAFSAGKQCLSVAGAEQAALAGCQGGKIIFSGETTGFWAVSLSAPVNKDESYELGVAVDATAEKAVVKAIAACRQAGGVHAKLAEQWEDTTKAQAALDPQVSAWKSAFGKPGTVWEIKLSDMSVSMTLEFLAGGKLHWVDYDNIETYVFDQDGHVVTHAPEDAPTRTRTWIIDGNSFQRVAHDSKDPSYAANHKGTILRQVQ